MGMECLLPSQYVNKLKITSAVHIHNQKGLMYYVELHLWAFRDLIHMCHCDSKVLQICQIHTKPLPGVHLQKWHNSLSHITLAKLQLIYMEYRGVFPDT